MSRTFFKAASACCVLMVTSSATNFQSYSNAVTSPEGTIPSPPDTLGIFSSDFRMLVISVYVADMGVITLINKSRLLFVYWSACGFSGKPVK